MNQFFKHLTHEFEFPLQNPVLIFSLILFIILLSPILLRKLNIPGIIGLIISGIIVGPYGFNMLEKNSAVELFSTIGLLYIMFIAGLELDMNEFKVTRNKSLLFGFFTFMLPLSIGYPVCHYLLGYDMNASFLTASMFATHTLVAYPIVSKMGITKNEAVAVAVGGTILTDTAVLILFAVIIGNSEGNLTQAFWLQLAASLTIFSIIMFFLIPKIARWFFQRLESENQAHYIFVLSVVFFAAFLAEVAGVEPIIGAFVAGLALNKLIPHSSALMNRIQFIGNALFIPFFLISVGMLVDLNVLMSGYTAIVVAVTLTIFSLFSKWLAALFTQLVFKYTSAQRQLIFGLSSAHAAATLAIILVGFKAGIIDENILNGTIILILFTCVVASFATERASKKIVLSDHDIDNDVTQKDFLSGEHILVSVSSDANIEKLLNFSFLIRNQKSVNPITMLSVVPNDQEAELNLVRTRKKLNEFVTQGAASEVKVNPITTIDHNPATGISRVSRELMADIILLGWPTKSNFINKLRGDKLDIDSIINNIDKNIFISNFSSPLISIHKIILISPPLAEKEFGFKTWIHKTARISHELSKQVVHFGDEKTQKAIQTELKQSKKNFSISYKSFSDWDDFLVLSREIKEKDLIILIAARKGSASYISKLENIPAKLEKHFEHNSKILIYPQQSKNSLFTEKFEDFSESPITKGIEKIEQLGKNIGNIFKKDTE